MFNLLLSAANTDLAGTIVGGIFGALLLILLIYAGIMSWRGKLSIEDTIEHKPEMMFKTFSSLSTITEAITLSLISINNGNTVFESFSRYTLLGLVEVLTSFWFMSSISVGLKELSANDNYNLKTLSLQIVKSIIPFLFSFMVTSLIGVLYLESINRVEIQLVENASILEMMFGLAFTIELNSEYFQYVDGSLAKRVGLGAILMVYLTTIINLMLGYQQFKEHGRDFKWFSEKKKDVTKDKNKDKSTSQSNTISTMYDSRVNTKYSIDSLLHYLPSFSQWFTPFSESDFNTWIIEYTGYDKDKDILVNSKINSSKIKNSTKDRGALALEILQELTNKLLGTDKNLIRGLSKIESDICEKIKTLEDSISQYKDKSSDYKSSSEGKADLNTITTLYDKINNTESKRKSMKSSLLDTFQTHNFLSNSSVKNEDDITNKLASLSKTKQSL